jgi:hypothetical protein
VVALKKGRTLKYMILTYASQQDYDGMAGKPGDDHAWSAEHFAAMAAFMDAFNKDLADSGELVETRALAAPAGTRRVEARRGTPVITDGPYAETEEVLAGYWIVECDTLDRATQIADDLTACPVPEWVTSSAVADVRPVLESEVELLH